MTRQEIQATLAEAAAKTTRFPAATPAQVDYLATLLESAFGRDRNAAGFAGFTLRQIEGDGLLSKRGASNFIDAAKAV